MTVNCRHWESIGLVGLGRCRAGVFITPTEETCLSRCTDYDGPPRTDAMMAEVIKVPKPAEPCASCNMKRIRWLGIEWVGVPKPVRWWRWAFTHGHPHPGNDIMWPGCGCIAYLYDLRRFWRAWRDRRHWKRRLDRRRLTP